MLQWGRNLSPFIIMEAEHKPDAAAAERAVGWRQSKKTRLWIIGILIVLAGVLFFMVKNTTAKWILAAAIAVLLGAFGMEATDKDYDLGTLAETGSLSAAKIERDADGNLTNVTAFCNAEKMDYNCDDFRTQAEAQEVYDRCRDQGRNMDAFRLDGDKDGRVCEALPAGTR